MWDFGVLFHVLVFMSFILKFTHGSCLFHVSLSFMSSCYWFPCYLCPVLIGFPSHVSCFPLVCSCHVTLIVFIISHNVVIVPGRVLTLYLLSVSLVCFMPSQVKSLFVFWISRLSINCTWVPMDAELGPGLKD